VIAGEATCDRKNRPLGAIAAVTRPHREPPGTRQREPMRKSTTFTVSSMTERSKSTEYDLM
jgi:hypothetical protein